MPPFTFRIGDVKVVRVGDALVVGIQFTTTDFFIGRTSVLIDMEVNMAYRLLDTYARQDSGETLILHAPTAGFFKTTSIRFYIPSGLPITLPGVTFTYLVRLAVPDPNAPQQTQTPTLRVRQRREGVGGDTTETGKWTTISLNV